VSHDAIIEALRIEVPPEIEHHVPTEWARQAQRGRCVQATRVGLEALRYFGVPARPLVTTMITGNLAWAEWVTAGRPDPMPEEVWAVGIDPDERGRGFPAHLVIGIHGHLLDLDAGFYARPQHTILMPETILLPVIEGAEPGATIAASDLPEGGVVLYYEPPTRPPNFRSSGAWKETRKWTGPVIRRMRERLA
jgi:hypothetical protein